MKLYVDPVTLGIGLVVFAFTLPSFFLEDQCSVTFINENGVKYEKTISCDDAEVLTVYTPSDVSLVASNTTLSD
jgi:predicted GNAT superfamily acetyltransferase